MMPLPLEKPRSPILIDRAFDDPDRIRALVRQNGPYWPTIRYVANKSELSAVGSGKQSLSVIPWFRQDWAYGESLVAGGDEVLGNKSFVDAAHQVFDAEVVNPLIVYVNVMGPMGVGPAHTDVPAFRGIDRTEFPVTLLHLMHRSGLFEEHRVSIATAVAWFYEGEQGEFEYWPEGAHEPSEKIEGPLSNRAVVGDNEVMFHRVGPIGSPGAARTTSIQNASLDVELLPEPQSSDWVAVDDGRELCRYDDQSIRISVSWKAEVFQDAEAARVREDHTDDLALDEVTTRFLADLAGKGVDLTRPEDPARDEGFIRALDEAYPRPGPQV